MMFVRRSGLGLRLSSVVSRPTRLSPPLISRRCYSTPASRFSPQVFGALLTVVGLATTAFVIYESYSVFTLWPPQIRSHLRAAVKAKHQKDLDLSERYFQKAWEIAQTLPLPLFGSAPILKLTGVLIAYAEVVEKNNRPEAAYKLMADYLDKLRDRYSSETGIDLSELNGLERVRIAAIAYRLGEMANTCSLPEDEEMKWHTFAVGGVIAALAYGRENRGRLETTPSFQELELPKWVSKTDVAAPLKALADFHAKKGNPLHAVNLYNATLLVLISDNDLAGTPLPDRCRAAQVISNLSELVVRTPPNPPSVEESQKQLVLGENIALIAAKCMIDSFEESNVSFRNESACSEWYSPIVANLGTINMMNGQLSKAKKFYEVSLRHAMIMGYKDQITQIQALIREAERAESSVPLPK